MEISITKLFVCVLLGSVMGCANDPKPSSKQQEESIDEKTLVKEDTMKQMNLLDEQAKMLGKVFGSVDSKEGRAFSKVNNYLDLLDQANFPPDIKKNLSDQYKIYELSLDPRKKDSLKLIFNQKLNEAMAKSLPDSN